jgi:hypothetical protein
MHGLNTFRHASSSFVNYVQRVFQEKTRDGRKGGEDGRKTWFLPYISSAVLFCSPRSMRVRVTPRGLYLCDNKFFAGVQRTVKMLARSASRLAAAARVRSMATTSGAQVRIASAGRWTCVHGSFDPGNSSPPVRS